MINNIPGRKTEPRFLLMNLEKEALYTAALAEEIMEFNKSFTPFLESLANIDTSAIACFHKLGLDLLFFRLHGQTNQTTIGCRALHTLI